MPTTKEGKELVLRIDPARLSNNNEDIDTWLTAMKIPFERAPRHGDWYTGEPYTLEGVLMAIREFFYSTMGRKQRGTPSPLGDFNNKVRSIVRGMVDDSSMVTKVVDDVLEAADCVDITTYHRCLQCDRFI